MDLKIMKLFMPWYFPYKMAIALENKIFKTNSNEMALSTLHFKLHAITFISKTELASLTIKILH